MGIPVREYDEGTAAVVGGDEGTEEDRSEGAGTDNDV